QLARRLVACPAATAFALAFTGAPHAALAARHCRTLMRGIFATGFVVAALGLYEFFSSSAWNDFMVNWAQVPRYKAAILNAPVDNPLDVRIYGVLAGRQFTRVGSVLFGPGVGFYLLIELAAGLYLIAYGRA